MNRSFCCAKRLRILMWLFLLSIIPIQGNSDSLQISSTLRNGAIILGIGGSLTATDDITTMALGLRLSQVWHKIGDGMFAGEMEMDYAHVRSADQLTLLGRISWQQPLENSPLHVIFSAGSGIRQEWVGSFRKHWYPLEGAVALRTMISRKSAIRVSYRFTRLFNAATSNFNEHRLVVGISLFFKN